MSWFRRVILWLLCLLATVMMIVVDLLGTAGWAVTDRRVHEHAALDSRVTHLQLERLEAEVTALAQKHHFAPETVMAYLHEEALQAYTLQLIDWWMSLMQPDASLDIPRFETGEIMDAVLQDEQFRAHNDADSRKLIARDSVAYEVGQMVRRAVFPLRQSILSLLLPQIVGVVDLTLAGRVLQIGWFALLGVAVMLVLITAVVARSFWKPLLCVLTSSAAVQTALWAALRLLNFPGMLGELNPVLGLQADIQLKGLLMLELVGLAVFLLLSLAISGRFRRRKAGEEA